MYREHSTIKELEVYLEEFKDHLVEESLTPKGLTFSFVGSLKVVLLC